MPKFNLRTVVYLVFVIFMTTKIYSVSQTLTTLTSFDGANGANPWYGNLVQGIDGNFYGTTYQGGTGTGCFGGTGDGCGTVFSITQSGNLRILHSFCSKENCADGYFPASGLVQTTDGNLYGTTEGGGASYSYGTVFKITTDGTLTTLYNFCSQANCADGSNPYGSLVQATNGNFYGTTVTGGANRGGTVFEITPSGKMTILYSFCSKSACADGSSPYAGLIQAADGNLYGTTYDGGSRDAGVVFKMTPAGLLTTLYSFCSQANCADGDVSFAPLAEGPEGNFYGTTIYGGSTGCCGTVFKITTTGQFTSLYTFCSETNCDDGGYPSAGLALADGKLYGTTGANGPNSDAGTLFDITTTGALTTLYSFCTQSGCTDGSNPFGGLIQSTDGTFYGTTYFGGMGSCNGPVSGCGTVFDFSVDLRPFVRTLPLAGRIGEDIDILGSKLAGVSAVSFNGMSAQFELRSPSLVVARIPEGAATGLVKVTLPEGMLSSNTPFYVLP